MKNSHQKEDGFTLIELLTVIAIIGILAAILIPVVGSVREGAKRAACASNIRQIGFAAHLYASENEDRLPNLNNAGNWAWDVSYLAITQLVQTGGGDPEMFFCPSSTTSAAGTDALWNFFDRDNVDENSFRITGYVHLFENPPGGIPAEHHNLKIGDPPPRTEGRSQVYETAAQRELVVDSVIGSSGNFTGIPGNPNLPMHESNHMEGSRPAGGNILFLDNHVEWRPFSEMGSGPKATGGPGFWW